MNDGTGCTASEVADKTEANVEKRKTKPGLGITGGCLP